VSFILIAMSEKTQNEKENDMESELDKKEKVKTIMELIGNVINANNEINEFMDIAVSNPFYLKVDKTAFNVVMDFSTPIGLPWHISLSVFGAEVEIVGIEINGAVIKLKYRIKTNGTYTYKIEMDNVKLPIKDLFLLLYTLSYLNDNDYSTLKMRLLITKNAMYYQKDIVKQKIESYGIKIEK